MLEYLVMQVRTLSELGWFLTLGTAAQLFALVVVVVKLFMSPLEGEHPYFPPCNPLDPTMTQCGRCSAFVLYSDLPSLICPSLTSWAV
jgi:hypothetical protein